MTFGHLREQVVDEPGGGVDDVLAVVQDEQQLAAGEEGEQALQGRTADGCAVQRRAERLGGGQRHMVGVGDRGQPDHPRAVRVLVGELSGDGVRGRGLPGAAGPDQRHQPGGGEQVAQRVELVRRGR